MGVQAFTLGLQNGSRIAFTSPRGVSLERRNKLFLRQLTPVGTLPDAYLFRISAADTGWIDRGGAWKCGAATPVSFSEGNGQQEVLLVLPPFGWVHGEHGTFCVDPRRDRPWIAVLSRAAR